jgi:hypothetical protein
MKTKLTLTNDFHHTSVNVQATDAGAPGVSRLSKSQAAKCFKALCGVAGCTCGGELGERGMPHLHSEKHDDGTVDLWFNV